MSVTINGTNGITFNNASTSAVGGVGDGQTWQNLTGSRAGNTNYTNSTGKPIMVNASSNSAGAGYGINLVVGGVAFPQVGANSNNGTWTGVCGIVPNGAVYQVTLNGGVLGSNTAVNWVELR